MRKKKSKILFVDDDKAIRILGKNLANEFMHKYSLAADFTSAKKQIKRRAKAITRLKLILQKRAEIENIPAKKNLLKRKIIILSKLEKRPYGLIISDINIPAGNPSGITFVRRVREKFPKQKIAVFSDDAKNMKRVQSEHNTIRKENIPTISKRDLDHEQQLIRLIKKGSK